MQASNDWHGVGVRGPGPGRGHQSQTWGQAQQPPASSPCPCHPPTGCCHTGWAAGRPRAARKLSTGPAARPRGPGLQRTGPPPQPCCWSWGLPQPRCCWPPHQGHWLRAQKPGLRRRPEAAAGQGLRGRPRPAGPSGRPAGPPGAPAAAVGVVAAVGQQSHWGCPGPAEGKRGEWADAGPGSGGCSAREAEVSVERGGHPQETQEASRGAAWGSRSADQRRGDRLDRRPRQGTQGQPGRAPGSGAPRDAEESWHIPTPRPGARSAGRLAGRPHLLGDLGCIQLVPELSSQPRETVSTCCSLPSADRIPVSLQRCLLTPGYSEDPAQLPGAWHARELLQEGRGQQQLLGTGCRGMAERSLSQEDTKGLAHTAQGLTLPRPAGRVRGHPGPATASGGRGRERDAFPPCLPGTTTNSWGPPRPQWEPSLHPPRSRQRVPLTSIWNRGC